MRSTRASPADSSMRLSDYDGSMYRSNSTNALDSVSLGNTKHRSLQTYGHQATSADRSNPVANPRKGSTATYSEHNGQQEDDSTKLPQFYGPTTTGVCIDEKVLKQISQNQAKFMQDRITIVAKHFGNLCDTFGGYARALCKVRDSGDSVATAVLAMAMDETINQTAKDSLTDFASHFSAVQDYEESEVRRIEEKVVKPLINYGTSCKQAKERLKKVCTIRKKELEQRRALEKTKEQKPFDMQHILQAQTNMQSASVNALRADNEVQQEIEAFETKKLEDLKQIMTDFVGIEVLYHMRALEQLTECSRALSNMDVNSDIEQFLSSLRPLSTHTRITMQHSLQKPGNERTSIELPTRKPTEMLTYPIEEYDQDEDDDSDNESANETEESDESPVETLPIKFPTTAQTRPVIIA